MHAATVVGGVLDEPEARQHPAGPHQIPTVANVDVQSSDGVPRPTVNEPGRFPEASRSASHDSTGMNPISSHNANDGSSPCKPSTSLAIGNSSASLSGTVSRWLPIAE
jgi:hypothetical protein